MGMPECGHVFLYGLRLSFRAGRYFYKGRAKRAIPAILKTGGKGLKLIDVNELVFKYGEGLPPVLNGVSLKIKKGEFAAVLGHNGSGKSTLAKHLNAVLLPTAGHVSVMGMDTRDEEFLYKIRQRVGMVFQNPDNQIIATVVEEDVAFAPENLGVSPPEIRERVAYALSAVDMYEYRKAAPHLLSGGQKQRVAIAGIIAMMPECIVLDEPTAMLDPLGRREVMETIRALNEKEGMTVILITHYMEEATKADRVVVMAEGKIIMDDEPMEVFTKVSRLKEVGLDVPQVTELMYMLKKKGIDVNSRILSVDNCASELKRLITGGAN